jgi:PHP family Zn ribbon phosphoesterase
MRADEIHHTIFISIPGTAGHSQDMEVKTLALWAKRKGIKLWEGDFTHPLFPRPPVQAEPLATASSSEEEPRDSFLLTAEVSNMYSQAENPVALHL